MVMLVPRHNGAIWHFISGTSDFKHVRDWSCNEEEPFALVYWSNLDLTFNIWTNLSPEYDYLFMPTVQRAVFQARRYYYKMSQHMRLKNMPSYAKRAGRILGNLQELETNLNNI